MRLILLILFSIILTTDSTHSQWTQCNNHLGRGVEKLKEIDNVIYAFSVDELYYSIDNAETWSKTNFIIECDIYDIHKSNGYLFLATSKGIYRSSNSGLTWSDRSFGLNGGARALESVGNYLFCIQNSSGSDLYVSTNNGDSWNVTPSNVKGASSRPYESFNRKGDNLYMLTENRIYTWNQTQFVECFPSNGLTYSDKVKSFATDGKLQIYNISGKIYRSIDGGKSRTQIKDCSFWAEVEFKDSLLYLYDNGIYTSSNYGETWKSITNKLDNQSGYKRYFLMGNDAVIVSSSSGVLKSDTKNQNSWASKNKGLSKFGIDMVSKVGDDLYISNIPNNSLDEGIGLQRSRDGGNSWSKLENGFLGKGKFSFVSNSNGILYTGNSSGLFRSNDNGENWTNIYSESSVKEFIANEENIYIVTDSRILESKDKGNSWITLYESRDIYSLVVVNNNLIACGYNGILVSKDKGVSWNHVLKTYKIKALHVYNSIVFAGGTTLFNSADFGLTWTIVKDNLPSINDIENFGSTLYLATDRGILKSMTNGSTWEYFNQGFSELASNPCSIFNNDSSVYKLVSISDNIYAATASSFVISRKIEKDDVSSIITQEDHVNFSVYPNPTFKNATIGVKVFSEADYITRIEVTDLIGNVRLQKFFDSDVLEAILELNELATSVYFIKIFTEKNLYTEKLLISN